MSYNIWTPRAVLSEARRWRAAVWRMVEVQHVASTMKIVDSRAEQDVLEALLESAKPPQPVVTRRFDYLLATPFRYPPRQGGSRFRSATDPGVFYAAESVRTAAAELGYWRWKFLQDAVQLVKIDPVAHSAFSVAIDAIGIDLRQEPFAVDAAAWMAPDDYSATQASAQVVRAADIQAIVYRSVRDPQPAWCVAVLSSTAFADTKPQTTLQSWWLAVYRDEVVWRRGRESMTFMTADWHSRSR